MPEETPQPKDDKSVSDLIQGIKMGTLDPGLLSKEQRQLCVEALYFEALSPTGIAQFLKVSDRTIRRDMEEIRAQNALTPNPDLARQIVGEFLLFAKVHRGNLMKLARNTAATTAERAQAEYYAHMIGTDMISKLQSLGYLPKSADALVVMQKKEEFEANEKLAAMVSDLDDMARLISSPEQAGKLLEIKDAVLKEDSDANAPQ